eukprot:c33798_g1_i1.p2 GENE.c33798_g1_i1~~c33798_g1_i1.p2  ORF type:complete len:162 (-),score=30.73 c33798_g1_i1:316-801(-)
MANSLLSLEHLAWAVTAVATFGIFASFISFVPCSCTPAAFTILGHVTMFVAFVSFAALPPATPDFARIFLIGLATTAAIAGPHTATQFLAKRVPVPNPTTWAITKVGGVVGVIVFGALLRWSIKGALCVHAAICALVLMPHTTTRNRICSPETETLLRVPI